MGGSKRTVWAGMAALGIAVIAGAAWFYAQQAGPGKDSGAGLARYATGDMAALAIPEGLTPATDHVFVGPDGVETRLADFRGQVVVVNLWATWCAPCLAEMPTLAALARTHADDDLLVLPISVDVPAQRDKAATFIAGHAPLPFYNDPAFQLPFEFGARGGMPQTILLDRQGRVRATFTGGADWSGAEAGALIEALLAEGS